MKINKVLSTFITRNKSKFVFIGITALQMEYNFPGESENTICVAGTRDMLLNEISLIAKCLSIQMPSYIPYADKVEVQVGNLYFYLEFITPRWFCTNQVHLTRNGYMVSTLASVFHQCYEIYRSDTEDEQLLFLLIWIFMKHPNSVFPKDFREFYVLMDTTADDLLSMDSDIT